MKKIIDADLQDKFIALGLNDKDHSIIDFLIENINSNTPKLIIADSTFLVSKLPLLGMSEADIDARIVIYKSINLLTDLQEDYVKDLLTSKSPDAKYLGLGNYKCEWCGAETVIINEIGYPIISPTGTVKICSNCKDEINYSDFYQINEEILDS